MSHNNHRIDPVFLLSPGRSGSTLLQRYLNCSTDLILWGEHGGFLKGIRNAYSIWCENQGVQSLMRQGRLHADLLISSKAAIGVDIEWTNNFSREHFRQKLAEMVTELFTMEVPAPVRWGFKEIRYDDKDIIFLRELFPLAQFVFIVRDPIDTLASAIVAFTKGRTLWETAEPSVETLSKMKEQLENHALRTSGIVKGIINCVEKNDGFLIKYEELRDNPIESVKRICQYLRCSSPTPGQIRLIASDVRQGTNTKGTKQRIKEEFLGEAYIQDILNIHRTLGYGQPVP